MSARQPKTKQNGKKNLRLKRVTALLIAAGCIVGPALAQTVIIGNNGFESLDVPPAIGIAGMVDTLIVGNTATGIGVLNFSSGVITLNDAPPNQFIVGNDGQGTVNMTGGTVSILNGDINTGALIVGNNSGSLGVFTQSGGEVDGGRSLTIGANGGTGTYNLNTGTDPILNVSILTLGYSGSGTFNQQDGTTVVTNNIFMGTDQATYNLSGGSLSVLGGQGTIVGTFNIATFNQSGGTHVTSELIVGNQSFARATYNMSGGTLTVQGDMLVGRGQADVDPGVAGLFRQTGGDVVTNTLWIGGDTRVPLEQHYGRGRYELVDGTVTSQLTLVGTISPGSVLQTGGTFNAGLLIIGRSGSFTAGGSLTEGSSYDLQAGILNTNGTTVSEFGIATFNHSGGAHNVTGNLVIGAETSFVDPFPGLGRVLEGTYNFSDGTLNVSGTTTLGREADSKGTINQSGGIATLSGGLIIANGENSVGIYNLTGSGVLNVTGDAVVGRGGAGVFTQNGSDTVHTVSGTLYLGGSGTIGGETASTSGTYNLMSGQLQTGSTWIGQAVVGVFNQTGGTHETGNILLGNCGGCLGGNSSGTYNLINGTLTAGSITVSGFGRGEYNQSGGVATVTTDLIVGSAPAVGGSPTREGFVNLSGGSLTVSGNVTIGAGNGVNLDPGFPGEPAARGTFNQSGGTHLVGGNLKIGQSGNVAGGTGLYTLSSGVVTVSGNTFIGGSGLPDGLVDGVGTFTQTGGTHTTIGDMNVGGGLGTYNLSGTGILNTGITYVNSNNGTSFNQSGGTHNTGFLNVYGGDYFLSGGTINVAGNMGVGGPFNSARFTQTGGDVFVNDPGFGLFVGGFGGTSNTGTYTLNVGTLTVVATSHIGSDAVGTFNQTGGTHTTSGLVLGENSGGNGTYNMSGGTLTVSANSYIGGAGTGTMNLTGNAVVAVTGNTYIGNNGTGANTGTLTIANNSSYTSNGAVPGGITLGQNAGSSGSIVISNAGTLSTFHRLTVGAAGKGSVLQSGTSVVTAGGLRVGEGATGGPSTYTMNGGTLNVTNTSGVEGGSRIGLAGTGTFNLNAGTHNTTFMEIGGTNFAQGSGGTGVYNLNGGTLVASGNISINPQGGSSGTLNVAGGGLTAPLIINNDKVNFSGGSITADIRNNANVNVSGGAPRILTGNLSNNTGGVLTVATATPFTVTGVLTNAVGALIQANANITVGKDYNNLGSGSGNTYDRRAGVTGAGQILAAGPGAATAQTLSGNVTGANVAGATMNFGNVRVGQSSTLNYAIGNSNTGGPDLRGAIQTTVNGANLTDARLTGAGVTAGTWGPVAAGSNNGGLGVTFTASSAGALSNQKVAIVNNFENTNSQVLTITGAAFNVAVGSTATPATVANQRIGGSNTATLNVTNAAAPGSFSEDLNVSVGGVSGATGAGAITGRVAGTNNTGVGAINVGVNTATAGAQSGTVTLNYQTAGTVNGVSNGLGTASVGSGNVTVNGNVYQIAQPSPGSLPATVNLGNFRAGAGAQSSNINIANTNAGAPVGFQEGLAANIGTTTGGATGSGFANAAVGTSGALQVGLSGIAAGVNSGTVQVQLQSNGITTTGSNGLTALNLGGPQTVTVTGTGFNAAVGNAAPSPVVVANQRIGANLVAALTVTNQAAPGAFSEDLRASFSGSSGAAVTVGGPINALLAGANDAATMGVRVDASSAGAKSGTVTLAYQTTGTVNNVSNGLGLNAANGPQVLNVSGNVYQVANPTPGALPATVNLGNFRAGAGAQSQNINITNTNIAPTNFQEGLAANIVTTTGTATGAGFANAQAGASGALQVGLSGIAAGVNTGTVQVQLQSNGITTAGSNGLGSLNLGGAQTVTVSGTGYRLAQANSIGAVNFGNLHVGDVANQALSISNTAVADGFSEKLNASFGTTTDARILTNGGSVSLLAGQTNSTGMVVSLNTAAAGVVSGSARVNLVSDGTGTSGLGLTNLPGQDVGVSGTITAVGNVYRLANPVIDTAQPVAFGNVRVGASASQLLSITNNVPNDGFSEKLNAQSGATTGGVTATGVFNLLSASATDNTNVRVGINTATAGLKNGTATINFQSDGTGTSNLGITNLASQNVTVTGGVYNVAVGNATPTPVALANQRVGGSNSQALTVSNTAAAGSFSEALNANFSGTTGNVINNGGGVTNLIAGGSNSAAMSVRVDTTTAGAKAGNVTIAYQTDGTGPNGNSGLTAISAGSQTINVSGNVYNVAVGSATPTPVALANQRVGGSLSQVLSVSNTAAAGAFSEALNANFSGATGSAANNGGSVSNLAAGSTNSAAMSVRVDTVTAGAKTGSVTLAYQTDGTGPNGNSGLAAISAGTQSINVSGNVYQVAQPTGLPATVNVGAFRTNGSPVTQTVTLSNNNISPVGFQEGLNAAITGTSGAATASGALNNVAAGNSGNLLLGVAGVAGLNTGSVQVQLATNGAGTSGLGILNLGGPQTVNVTGLGYTAAQANVQPNVNFGIVHVGDVVATRGVSVQNSAPVTALNDTLRATIGGATGPFTSSGGPVSGLAAGATDSTTLRVGLNTTAAGVYNSGSASVGLTSQNTDMADLALIAQTIALSGQVNNYANALFDKVSGAGTLTRSGNLFTLDFGTVLQGSAALGAIVDVDNFITGPADLLDGSLNVTDGNDFTTLLSNAFADVVAGGSSGDLLQFLFNTNNLGAYSDLIDLTWFGHNASGYQDSNQVYSLRVTGTVIEANNNVPEPSSLLLMGLALAGLITARRREYT